MKALSRFLLLGPTLGSVLAVSASCVAVERPDHETGADQTLDDVGEELQNDDCQLPPSIGIQDDLVVWEGDMVLGHAEELDSIATEFCNRAKLRGIGLSDSSTRWPGGVVRYVIDPELAQKDRVIWAVAHWEAMTSLDFVDVTNSPGGDYIRFKNHNDACSADTGYKGGEQFVRLSTGKEYSQIRGMAINKDDNVYTWYDDGMVTVGSSSALESVRPQYPYVLPDGYATNDIIEIAIHPTTQKVYAWYYDRTFSVGNSRDLAAYLPPTTFEKPNDKALWRIRGIDFSQSGTLYTWYTYAGNLYRVLGTPGDLSAHGQTLLVTEAASIEGAQDAPAIKGIGISSANWVYAWYSNGQATAGFSTNLAQHKDPYDYKKPGDCSFSSTVHEIGHAVGLLHEHTRCDRGNHVRVYYGNVKDDKKHNFYKRCNDGQDYGSYDKDSIMHYGSTQFSKTESPTLLIHPPAGSPIDSVQIVGSAIASNDHVYTWWSNGTVTSGTSTNLESRRSRYYYTFPPAEPGGFVYDASAVVGIAIAKSTDRVYTWYKNGKVSVGTTDDLDYHTAPYDFYSPYPVTTIRGIAISEQDNVYAWYEHGGFKASRGTSDHLSVEAGPYNSSLHPNYSSGDIRGIAISTQDKVFTWYDTGHLTRGTTDNLDAHDPDPIAVRGRGIKPQKGPILSAGDVETIESMY